MEFIDIKKQYQHIKTEVQQAINEVLEEGNFIFGRQVFEIEKTLADYVGVKHCVSCASGTDSLEMALMALNIGPGDEVITTPYSWISSAEVILLLGATPVFVDIDPVTFNIDVNKIEAAITPKTKAIIAVSLFGQMPDFTQINALCEPRGITVIEDGAQSFGATQRGKKSCGVTTMATTSFFPAKPLGCYGDGGAIFTDDDTLAYKLQCIRNHGTLVRHEHTMLGYNARFDTLQAAILLANGPYFNEEVKKRDEIGAYYSEKLKEIAVTPVVQEGNTHMYSQYTLRIPNRDGLGAALKEKGIPTAIYYPKCIHEQPVFAPYGFKEGDFPVAELAAKEVISLPMHPWLELEEQTQVIDAVYESVGAFA